MTQVNFSNIIGEIKFIDSLKYHQKSLEKLAPLSIEEKISARELTEQFFNQHHYYSKVGKGVIPFELNINMESFFLIPENEFWEKKRIF